MRGCLGNTLATIGCLTVLAFGGVLAWHYRAQLGGLYHSVVRRDGQPAEVAPADTTPTFGRPSAAALASALRKEAAMAEARGPGYVSLNAAEMASLIAEGLDPAARRALDSLEVGLTTDRFELRAQLRTAMLGGLLGPFAGMLAPREPLRLSGPARVGAVGVVAWEPDSFVIRSFPFPPSAVPSLVNRLTGRKDGAVPIGVPPTVGDLRVRPRGVTFYRRVGK